MTTREQLEAEAAELYGPEYVADANGGFHDLARDKRAAFIAGRTVAAEQVQAVARVLDGQNGNLFNEEALAEDALEAASLLIEGEQRE